MSDEQLPVRYEAGYGKPPAKHRYEKSKSGNPKGRSKRAKPKHPKEINTGFGMKTAEEFLRLQAYRPVTIREGEQVFELPANHRMSRSVGETRLFVDCGASRDRRSIASRPCAMT